MRGLSAFRNNQYGVSKFLGPSTMLSPDDEGIGFLGFGDPQKGPQTLLILHRLVSKSLGRNTCNLPQRQGHAGNGGDRA